MTQKFHMACYDDVDQVVRTRQRRQEAFSRALQRVRGKLLNAEGQKGVNPLTPRWLDIS